MYDHGMPYPEKFYGFDMRASHARTLPAALASILFGFVLVRVHETFNRARGGNRVHRTNIREYVPL